MSEKLGPCPFIYYPQLQALRKRQSKAVSNMHTYGLDLGLRQHPIFHERAQLQVASVHAPVAPPLLILGHPIEDPAYSARQLRTATACPALMAALHVPGCKHTVHAPHSKPVPASRSRLTLSVLSLSLSPPPLPSYATVSRYRATASHHHRPPCSPRSCSPRSRLTLLTLPPPLLLPSRHSFLSRGCRLHKQRR
jgi:hypothetical protein